MGDPKKIRKKYETPSHPWIKARIVEESRVRKKYATANKKEIWKMESVLKNFKTRAKNLIVLDSPQSKIETQHLFTKVQELGLLQNATFDDILGLSLDDLMDRRLQSIVFKKGLARSVKQARQFIVHEHILVEGKKITSPSYFVKVKEEAGVMFSPSSALFSEQHPERASSIADDDSDELSTEDNAKKAKAMAKGKKSAKQEEKQHADVAKEDESSQEVSDVVSEELSDDLSLEE
jgi:small subunit ribosomal protein S4